MYVTPNRIPSSLSFKHETRIKLTASVYSSIYYVTQSKWSSLITPDSLFQIWRHSQKFLLSLQSLIRGRCWGVVYLGGAGEGGSRIVCSTGEASCEARQVLCDLKTDAANNTAITLPGHDGFTGRHRILKFTLRERKWESEMICMLRYLRGIYPWRKGAAVVTFLCCVMRLFRSNLHTTFDLLSTAFMLSALLPLFLFFHSRQGDTASVAYWIVRILSLSHDRTREYVV